MISKIRKAMVGSVLLTAAVVLTGCASLGPAYQKVQTMPENTGVIYLYRPSQIIGGAAAYEVKAGDTVIVTMVSGGYYPYFSKPGEIELWAKTEAKSSVTLDVKPGQVQYVKCTVGVGFFIGRPHLMVVSPEVAEPEIAACKLIPEKK